MHHSRKIPISAVVLMVATLYFAKEILVPLALAVLLSFLLAPQIRALERRGLPRTLAVGITALTFFFFFAVLGWITAKQVSDLAAKIPAYQGNIQHKLEALHSKGSSFQNAADILARIDKRAGDTATAAVKPDSEQPPVSAAHRETGGPDQPPMAVRIVDPPASPPQFLRNFFGPLLAPLGMAGIVLVFTIFILIAREDLRDRLLHLAGPAHLPLTTQAIDEAAGRVSGYLQAEVAVNGIMGVAVGTGLFFIGVPHPALWGLLTAIFRFVPYVGYWTSALAPIALSMAAFQSWWPVALTAALFITLELVTSNVLEPWIYGARTGLTPVAIVVAATFWTWLWGIEGLLLSTPLTVCIVVLGRYVPQLEFLHTLLGDEPVLPLDTKLYQRLLASDQEEVAELVETCFETQSCVAFYDEVVIPALNRAQLDARRGILDEDRQRSIHHTLRTLAEDLRDHPEPWPKPEPETSPVDATGEKTASALSPVPSTEMLPLRVLILPVKTDADEIAGLLLGHVLTMAGVGNEVLPFKALVNEMTATVSERQVPIVCLSVTRPFAVMQVRHLAKRLRAAVPGLKILIGLWDVKKAAGTAHRNLESVQANWVVSTLAEAAEQLRQAVPCLPEAPAPASPGDASSSPSRLPPWSSAEQPFTADRGHSDDNPGRQFPQDERTEEHQSQGKICGRVYRARPDRLVERGRQQPDHSGVCPAERGLHSRPPPQVLPERQDAQHQ